MGNRTFFDKLRYDGKRVIVTGAASGIGYATAEVLNSLGAEVIAMDIKPTDVGSSFVHLDLLDEDSINASVDQVGGPVDSLFACAGLGSTAPFDAALICNFVGMRCQIDRLIPVMPRGSSIVITSSTAGRQWQGNLDKVRGLVETSTFDEGKAWVAEHVAGMDRGYRHSKWAVRLYTTLKAVQLAPLGIRINTVSPHATITPMWETFKGSGFEDRIKLMTGLEGKTAGPEEQGYAMAYINSEAGGHINGTDLSVDGGFVAGQFVAGLEAETGGIRLPQMQA